MIPLSVGDKTYLLEFKHRKRLGKNPELYAKAPLNAVTSCAIFSTDDQERPFAAIGTAICVRDDRFERPMGRDLAFIDAVNKCGMLRGVAGELGDAYRVRFPVKSRSASIDRPRLSDERRAELKAAGQENKVENRAERRERRKAAKSGKPQRAVA